jgi:hypothetical protein
VNLVENCLGGDVVYTVNSPLFLPYPIPAIRIMGTYVLVTLNAISHEKHTQIVDIASPLYNVLHFAY